MTALLFLYLWPFSRPALLIPMTLVDDVPCQQRWVVAARC